MATRVTLNISIKEQPEGSGAVLLSDDFDDVFNKIVPVNPPSSSLEARVNLVHVGIDGNRVLIMPQSVVMVEENASGPE